MEKFTMLVLKIQALDLFKLSNTHYLNGRTKNSELIGTTNSAMEMSFAEGLFLKYSEDSH